MWRGPRRFPTCDWKTEADASSQSSKSGEEEEEEERRHLSLLLLVWSSLSLFASLLSMTFACRPWRDFFPNKKRNRTNTHTHLFVTPSFHQSIRERKSVEREKDNYWGISSNLLCNLRHLISIKTKYIIRIFIVLGFFPPPSSSSSSSYCCVFVS